MQRWEPGAKSWVLEVRRVGAPARAAHTQLDPPLPAWSVRHPAFRDALSLLRTPPL